MSRFGRKVRVLFSEEPVFADVATPHRDLREVSDGVFVLQPTLPTGLTPEQIDITQAALLETAMRDVLIRSFITWYYTPRALRYTEGLHPKAVVYDCMDELTGFLGAPADLVEREKQLFAHADLVFTGGRSLYEAKSRLHPRVHEFPSSVDVAHFSRARELDCVEPGDQRPIPHPRLGFMGVIDERLDVPLLRALADEHPEWQFVMVGPVVKIDPAMLPRRPNVHYLGAKAYAELPAYLSGWDVGLLPFARNDATRFLSPTKTPEYLAAGCPVVSTPIADVVGGYGSTGLVRIAGSPVEFARQVQEALAEDRDARLWARVDERLARMSWDRTWSEMDSLVQAHLRAGGRAARPQVLPRVNAALPGGLGR